MTLRRLSAAALAPCAGFLAYQHPSAHTEGAVPLVAASTQQKSIHELFSLEGKTALVTGGSQGLGKAIARGLALAGADVIIASRREPELRAALKDIVAGTTVRGEFIVADLGRDGEAERLGHECLRRTGRVDIFIDNAGISRPGAVHTGRDDGKIPPLRLADFDATLAVNLTAGVRLLNVLAPAMVANGWGRVVHISSIGGLGSSEGRTAYSASKHAQIGITHAAALELGPHGVTVNTVCPGPFLTEMPLTMLTKEVRDGVAGKVPLRRWGDPTELVGPVLMLVSEAGAYVNGSVLRVDGGLLSRAY